MSLGSSDMAGSALGMVFSFLLLASITQGLQDVEVFYEEKMEAVVGQNVTLPCTVKSSTTIRIVSVEWRKNKEENTKLAVYSPGFGHHRFWPNVTIQTENTSMGSLLLSRVSEWDSGTYICELTTFPHGSIRRETELQIKGDAVQINCDVNSTLEVHAGENVIIRCEAPPDAQYRWTKNERLVSDNGSLELWWVTDAHTGVYTLTVNTGNKSVHKEFILTVLTATTSLRTDLTTVSPKSNVSDKGLTEPADSSFTSTPTTVLSTTETAHATWTTTMDSDVTDNNPNPSNVTPFMNYTNIGVTSSPATHTDPNLLNTSSYQEINPTRIFNTSPSSDQPKGSYLSTTLPYDSTVTTNESMMHKVHPEVNSSTSPEASSTLGSITKNLDNSTAKPALTTENEETDGVRSHLLLLFIIAPVLVLIVVAGILYRRRIIRDRMDLPPPFKPPPPPVKYTSVVQHDTSKQPYPVSKCNSITQLGYMRETRIP